MRTEKEKGWKGGEEEEREKKEGRGSEGEILVWCVIGALCLKEFLARNVRCRGLAWRRSEQNRKREGCEGGERGKKGTGREEREKRVRMKGR